MVAVSTWKLSCASSLSVRTIKAIKATTTTAHTATMKESSRNCQATMIVSVLLFSSNTNAFFSVGLSSRSPSRRLRTAPKSHGRSAIPRHQTSDDNDGNVDSVMYVVSDSTLSETLTPTALLNDESSVVPLTSSAQFGDVVSLKRPTATLSSSSSSSSTSSSVATSFEQRGRTKNWGVAALSIGLAVMNYVWQYLHPTPPIQLLYSMAQQSSPITVIGTTNKPTLVDFWAPWCENCKLMAPTLKQIEEEFGSDVNFVMINGDDDKAWPMIEAFGVDAIPHLALVEADGTVATALIGPVPKQWLERDLQVLKENAQTLQLQVSSEADDKDQTVAVLQPLPYQMLDVFANRPNNERRIQVTQTQQ